MTSPLENGLKTLIDYRPSRDFINFILTSQDLFLRTMTEASQELSPRKGVVSRRKLGVG